MPHYHGDRTIDGIVVTVDGDPLDPCYELHTYSDLGFEWTYEGDSPRQLALALLADHLRRRQPDGAEATALALVEAFMRTTVANFANSWTLDSADIERAVQSLQD